MKAYNDKDKFGNLFCTEENLDVLKEKEYIICVNKKEEDSQKFLFFCCVCNKDICGVKPCQEHWKNEKHKKKSRNQHNLTDYLVFIPPISSFRENEISQYVENLRHEGLTSEELEQREGVCQRIESILRDGGLTDIYCRLCGSSATGIGFHKATVDISLKFDIEKICQRLLHVTDTSSLLLHIVDVLNGSDDISRVEELFHEGLPKIEFEDKTSGLKCCIGTLFQTDYQLTQLVKKYLSIDGRVKKLCLSFKYWAKVCCLDDPQSGSLPPTSFTIMVIHYLQQVKPPVLPIVKISPENMSQCNLVIDETEEEKLFVTENEIHQWKSDNNDSIGKLFVGLLRYYLLEFHFKSMAVTVRQISPMIRVHQKFESKGLAIEDPCILKKSITSTVTSAKVMVFFTECMETSYRYLVDCHLKPSKLLRLSQNNVKKVKKKVKKKGKRKTKGGKDRDKKDTTDCKTNDLKEDHLREYNAVVCKKQNIIFEKIDPALRPSGIKGGREFVAIDTTKCSGKMNLKVEKKDLYSTVKDHCKPKNDISNVHAVTPKGKKAKKRRRRKNKGNKGLERKGTNEGNTYVLKENLVKKTNSDKTESSGSVYVNKDYEAIVQYKQTKLYGEHFPETNLDGENIYREHAAIDTTESSAKVNLQAEREDLPSGLKGHHPLENGDTQGCVMEQSTISSPNSDATSENDGKTELKNEQRDHPDIKESLAIIKNLVDSLLRAKSDTPKIMSVYQTNEESSKDVKTKNRREKLNSENNLCERVERAVGLGGQLIAEGEKECTRHNQTQNLGQTSSSEVNLIEFQETSNNKPKQDNDEEHVDDVSAIMHDVLENVSEEFQDCENLATTQKKEEIICRNLSDISKPLFEKDFNACRTCKEPAVVEFNQKLKGLVAFDNAYLIDGNNEGEKCKTSNDAIEMTFKVEANVSGETKTSIEFTKENLTLGRKVPVVCNICHAENHHFKECPLV